MLKIIKPICVLICTLSFVNKSFSQLIDLARVDYTIVPKTASGIEYTRLRSLFNYPIKLKTEDSYLFLGVDYSNVQMSFFNRNSPFNVEEINDFQSLDLSISYIKPLKNDWLLGVKFEPGISSNLAVKGLSFEDVVFSGLFVFIKESKKKSNSKKPWRLIIGASYSGNRGFSYPLPFIDYYHEINEKWSYNLGVPKSLLRYNLSDKNNLKIYVELDGFTGNIQNGLVISGSNHIAQSLNISLLTTGIQHSFQFTKIIEMYTKASYTISNRVKLRDNKRKNIITLDNESNIYLQLGIRLKIDK